MTTQAAALTKLYSVTGGPMWYNKDGWASLTDANVCSAHGIVCSGTTVIGLHLDSNNLQGPLPDVFGALSGISALSFYNNTLVGAVPESLMDLPSLDHVDLRTNHLDGPVPNFAIDYSRGGNCLLNDNDFTCHLDMTTGCVVDTVPECNGNVPTGTVYNTNPGLSKGAIAGIAISCVLVFASILGVAVFLYQRRKSARRTMIGSDDLPSYGSATGGRRSQVNPSDVKAIDGADGPWWTRDDVKVDPSAAGADGMVATSNVRRFPVDGAYPGMPGYRHADAEVPAFASNTTAVGVSSTRPRRASDGDIQLNNPIVTRASEDHAQNDLAEAGAASPSAAPATTSSGALGFLGRMFGGSSTAAAVPSSEEEADNAEEGDYEAPEGSRPRASSAGATDAKGMYSHQTAFAAASAKRAAAARAKVAAKKGARVPTVTKARGPSM
ncbi:hypothetical protein DFJ73DRAFT_765764 [Zopfochytrium polystomum]|nr:hypothetical protein DFJ73DRAFT_765764 [Zopfochytrium polystomum]